MHAQPAAPRPAIRPCRWGSLRGGALRHGGRHYRLVVFPPGTSPRERLWLRTWLCWPYVGLASASVAILLAEPVGVVAAAVLAGSGYAAGFGWLRHRVRRQRNRLCVVHAEYLPGVGSASELRLCEQLLAYASVLAAAESSADRGELSPVDFEYVWSLVHTDAMALARADRPVEKAG